MQTFIRDMLVEEKKQILNHLLNKSALTNLTVDSGEITAKLELSNFYETTEEDNDKSNEPPIKPGTTNIPPIRASLRRIDPIKSFGTAIKRSELSKPVYIKEIVNAETKQTTVLVDKSKLEQGSEPSLEIPKVRIVAKPVTMKTESNLFSEIKIKFRI